MGDGENAGGSGARRVRSKRPKGTGSVVHEGNVFRARLPGTRDTVALESTYEAADAKLRAALELFSGKPPEAAERMTLAGWMTYSSELRKSEGVRDVRNEQWMVGRHVVRDAVGGIPIGLLTRDDCLAWVARLCTKGGGGRGVARATTKPLSARTIVNVTSLVRTELGRAVELHVLSANPMERVAVPRAKRRVVTTEEPFTILEVAEQRALVRALDSADGCAAWMRDLLRALVLVALGTGVRKSELLRQRWEDVQNLWGEPGDTWMTVRYSRGGGATKGGKPRRIPLFGLALDALRAWATIQTTHKGRSVKSRRVGHAQSMSPRARARDGALDLASSGQGDRSPLMGESQEERRVMPVGPVFPGPRGKPRGKVPIRHFENVVRKAGIGRHVDWHALRHTCATSLLEGMWGPAWTVTECQQMLGHVHQATTEKYLHARGRLLHARAQETYGFRDAPLNPLHPRVASPSGDERRDNRARFPSPESSVGLDDSGG